MPKLRVGIVNFLNSKPLAWGFLKGHHADLFAPSYHPPALVARLLGQGDLDIGLIPSIEVQRIPGLKVLPDLCVAAPHEVRSVILVSRRTARAGAPGGPGPEQPHLGGAAADPAAGASASHPSTCTSGRTRSACWRKPTRRC